MKIAFLWVGTISAVALALLGAFFWDEIMSSPIATVTFVIAATPAAITYSAASLSLVKRYRWWTLVVVPLLLWPRIYVLDLWATPFAYMGWLLAVRAKGRRNDRMEQ
jgi:hypothetical membrane protein